MNEIVTQEPTKEQLLDMLRGIDEARRTLAIFSAKQAVELTEVERGMIVAELTTKHGMTHRAIAIVTTMGAR